MTNVRLRDKLRDLYMFTVRTIRMKLPSETPEHPASEYLKPDTRCSWLFLAIKPYYVYNAHAISIRSEHSFTMIWIRARYGRPCTLSGHY